VKPHGAILPVRTMYNGFTHNVGNNYLTDDKPIWVAGPDLINSAIQNDGNVPRIRDDLFRKIIEDRKRHESDKELYHWLKIFANSIYGCFVEINPETLPREKSVRVRVYSGEESFIPNKRNQVIEREGQWYAPYLGSLITAGGRLLLGMLEKCQRGDVSSTTIFQGVGAQRAHALSNYWKTSTGVGPPPIITTLPSGKRVAVCPTRGADIVAVGVEIPVWGSYTSAVAVLPSAVAVPPPTISTLPFESSVAVWYTL